jgi:subtilisin family serine protease
MPATARRVASVVLAALTLLSRAPLSASAEDAVSPSVDPQRATPTCQTWVVKLKGPFETDFAESLAADDVARSTGATLLASVKELHAHLFDVCSDTARAALTNRTDQRLELAFPNVGMKPAAVSSGAVGNQWYLHNEGQPYFAISELGVAYTNVVAKAAGALDSSGRPFDATVSGDDIKWNEARSKFPGINGDGVTVAVVDTGVDVTLPELRDRIATGGISIDCNLNSSADVSDFSGHGTRNASLIASNGANGGMSGVAPRAMILAVAPQSCDTSNTGGVIQYAVGLAYGGEHAQVVNMSNGLNIKPFSDYAGPGVATSLYLQALQFYKGAVDDAVAHGAIVVASSGNGGDGNELGFGFLPGDYLFPASFPHVVSVGASQSDGVIAPFSQWNDQVDVVAPGKNILALRSSLVSDCGSPGDYACLVNMDGTGGVGAQYSVEDGTSFSAPLVSGAAALAKQKWPRITSDQFEQLIRQTADDEGPIGYDVHYGAGQLNLDRLLSYNFPPSVTAVEQLAAVTPGGPLQLRAQVDDMDGDGDLSSVTADLSPLGVTTPVALVRTGAGIFDSAAAIVPSTISAGSYQVHVTASDSAGNTAARDATVQVSAAGQTTTPPSGSIIAPVTQPTSSISITTPTPSEELVIADKSIDLAGAVSADIALIEVNGQSVTHAAGSSTWNAHVELSEGVNHIVVKGYDLARTKIVTAEALVTRDTEAPGRVRGLQTSPAGLLTWQKPSDGDVEGYRIYRIDNGKAHRVGITRKKEYQVTGGGTYAVVAEDHAGNALETKKAATVESQGTSPSGDVTADSSATSAMQRLVARGIMQGNIGPQNRVTRAEFAKLLSLAYRKQPSGTSALDVPASHSLAPYVAIAVRLGWAAGDHGHYFPDRSITRIEAARMLLKADGLRKAKAESFSDLKGDDDLVATSLRLAGIMQGVGGQFLPSRVLTREEAAKIVVVAAGL